MNETRTDKLLILLDDGLPTSASQLKDRLRETERAYVRAVEARVEAHAELQNARLRYLHPKDKDMTDFDRKVQLEANTSDLQAEYELLAGIEKALEQRISVIQTLLVQ